MNSTAPPIFAPPYDLAGFRRAVAGVELIDDPERVRQRSRDFYWFSPVAARLLADKSADLIARPRDEAEVRAVSAACARLRIPLTLRGAGTGTYGQGVPLHGGVVLDTTGLDSLPALNDERVRAGAGLRIHKLDAAARQRGRELRMHPSTKRAATIGGYFTGGSGGIGSVTYGGLREPGNLLGARVLTLEEAPRVLTLRGDDAALVNRTYGTTGIVVEVELPLTEALPWRDLIVTFETLEATVRFADALARDGAIRKKLVCVLAASASAYLTALASVLGPRDAALLMVADEDRLRLASLAREFGGTVTHDADSVALENDPRANPLYEYTWGHTTLNARKVDASLTYLQTLFAGPDLVEKVLRMVEIFGDEIPMHLEFIRYEGEVAANGAQLLRWRDEARLEEIIHIHETHGIPVANPHVHTLEGGSRHKRVPGDQLAFKALVDPYGLLNPGKMTDYVPVRR